MSLYDFDDFHLIMLTLDKILMILARTCVILVILVNRPMPISAHQPDGIQTCRHLLKLQYAARFLDDSLNYETQSTRHEARGLGGTVRR